MEQLEFDFETSAIRDLFVYEHTLKQYINFLRTQAGKPSSCEEIVISGFFTQGLEFGNEIALKAYSYGFISKSSYLYLTGEGKINWKVLLEQWKVCKTFPDILEGIKHCCYVLGNTKDRVDFLTMLLNSQLIGIPQVFERVKEIRTNAMHAFYCGAEKKEEPKKPTSVAEIYAACRTIYKEDEAKKRIVELLKDKNSNYKITDRWKLEEFLQTDFRRVNINLRNIDMGDSKSVALGVHDIYDRNQHNLKLVIDCLDIIKSECPLYPDKESLAKVIDNLFAGVVQAWRNRIRNGQERGYMYVEPVPCSSCEHSECQKCADATILPKVGDIVFAYCTNCKKSIRLIAGVSLIKDYKYTDEWIYKCDCSDSWLAFRHTVHFYYETKKHPVIKNNSSKTPTTEPVTEPVTASASARDASGSTARPGDSDAVAYKTDNGKNRLDEIPGQALWEIAKVFSAGAAKYPAGNWRKNNGMAWSRPYGALWRHVLAWQGGESYDKESGAHHLSHAIWNLIALMLYDIWGWTEKDDIRQNWFEETKK